MGADIYVHWDRMRKKSLLHQTLIGNPLKRGKYGYIRVSEQMTHEQEVLKKLFTKKYWEQDFESTGIEYDFKKNMKKMRLVLKDYVKNHFSDITQLDWAISVQEFFRKGQQLQKKQLNPKIVIEW